MHIYLKLNFILIKISEIVNENLMLKGKYMTQVEKLDQTKSETKTKDETMKRLVDTINKFEKDSISTTLLINQFKVVSSE